MSATETQRVQGEDSKDDSQTNQVASLSSTSSGGDPWETMHAEKKKKPTHHFINKNEKYNRTVLGFSTPPSKVYNI